MPSDDNSISRFGELLNKIEKVFIFIGAITLLFMTALIVGEIIARKFFKTSIFITLEYSGYGLAIIMMLSLASVTRKKGHLTVEFLVNMLPSGMRRWIDLIFSVILFFIYNVVITYVCYRLFSQSFVLHSISQDASRTPLWIPQIILFVGIVVTDLQLLHNLFVSLDHSNKAPASTNIQESEGKE